MSAKRSLAGRMFSRRQAVAGVLALVAGRRAWGSGRLGDGRVLPSPDFSAFREANPYVVGVRPHRAGGVRLERTALEGTESARSRWLIHNYGHGGAGITLGFGCAARVVELVAEAVEARGGGATLPTVAVIGLGMAGLCSATEIRRRWPTIRLVVYAASLDPTGTTSHLAGGQFEPSGVWREYQSNAGKVELAAHLERSHTRVGELYRAGGWGIEERANFTLDHENRALDEYMPRSIVAAPRFGTLPFERLVSPGREYQTWLINPTMLLPRLIRELRASGTRFVERTFVDGAEFAALPENIVVNCTGLGAATLFSDTQLRPQRGHLIMLKKTDENQDYFYAGGCENFVTSYVFCRQDDIVVGGTVYSGESESTLTPRDADIFSRVVQNAKNIFDGRPADCVA